MTRTVIKTDPGYCLYGAQTILPLLSALCKETDGIKGAEDSEYVHRCRVATRRIRAALPLFSDCISKSKGKEWRRDIRGITQALGDARDLDVQIAFIEQFIAGHTRKEEKKPIFSLPESQEDITDTKPYDISLYSLSIIPKAEKKNHRIFSKYSFHSFWHNIKNRERAVVPSGTNPDLLRYDENRIGLECLLLRLKQRREAVQPTVIRAVESFVAAGTMQSMQDHLQTLIASASLHDADIHSPYAYEQAFLAISKTMQEVLFYESYIKDPSQIQNHHAMRIAAKHLRYTLEAFNDLFSGRLQEEIKALKNLQDILGEMHDCDVWNVLLPRFLEEEEAYHKQFFGNTHVFEMIMPGVTYLMDLLLSRRFALHQDLVRYWDKLKKDDFFNQIRAVISLPLQTSFHHLIDIAPEHPVTIALIGDVHANLPALEAVLEDARKRGADAIINVGDFVGYGAFPDEVITTIRGHHILSTIGNFDRDVILQRWKKGKKSKGHVKKFAMEWAYHAISEENRAYLGSLPKDLRLTLRNKTIYATHGTPDSLTEYITSETPKIRLREFAQNTKADIIVTGHSHEAFAIEMEGVWFVNTGSVGRPDDGDPRASYALLTLSPFSLYHFRVPYDVERAITAIYEKNLPSSFARIIKEGRPLDIIRHADDKVP